MDSTLSHQLTQDELNAAALYQFVYTDVTHQMICYLAEQTRQVISCDPPSEQSMGQTPDAADDGPIPELEEFITALVQCSNVQVPTLMSTLVYLTRLRARLQPQAKGRRSTPHRIFLAALILSAKYLNDSSPKNKHWARYTKVQVKVPSFEGVKEFKFHTAEVNEMERQLLFLLNFELRITEHDLYRELNPYLAPIRNEIAAQHARRQRRKLQERERQRKLQQEQVAAYSYPSPPSSRGHSRAGSESRSSSGTRETYTPSLTSSSASSRTSPASSTWSANSGKSPLGDADQAYVYCADVEEAHLYQHRGGDMLPYEVTAEEIRAIQEAQKAAGNNKGGVRAIFGRVFGNTAPVAAR